MLPPISLADTCGNIEKHCPTLPNWVKGAAKLLNTGEEGRDWQALAKELGTFAAFIYLIYLMCPTIISVPPTSKKMEGHFAFESVISPYIYSSCFSCEQEILITILARAFKLGELIGAEE